MGVGALMGARGRAGPGEAVVSVLTSLTSSGSASFFSICGGMSVVLCFPWVHGSMSMNSSKVRTRGLQHFHPVVRTVSRVLRVFAPRLRLRETQGQGETQVRTFLAFMEYGWAWMVPADLFSVCVSLATSLMDAFLGHVGRWKPSFGLSVVNSSAWDEIPRSKVRKKLVVSPLVPECFAM